MRSLRIKDHVTYNQIIIANELNNYFLNTAGSITNKNIVDKGEEVNPLQRLFKHVTQPFKEMSWSYTSAKEINDIIYTLKDKHSSGYDKITPKII
jgi:hypothetical protein